MISSSVGSGHPRSDKSSCEIPHEYVSRQGNLSGKIISIKRDVPSRKCCDFFRTALFSDKLLLHMSPEELFWHNSYFFRAAISSKQLLFLRSSFFRTVISRQQLFFQKSYFFRAKLLSSSHFLKIRISLGQLHFGTATFLAEKLFRTKISTVELLFRRWYFCTASTFSEELHFGKS